LTGKITFAKGHYDTDYGRISAEWKREGDEFSYTVSMPQEIECEFEFSDMEITSRKNENGEYHFKLIAERSEI